MRMPDVKYAHEHIKAQPWGTIVLYELFNPSNIYSTARRDKDGNIIDELKSSESHRNVFLVDDVGDIIWRIADYDFGDTFDRFISVYMSEDNTKAIGQTFQGHIFEIDLRDGSLKKIGWTK